MLNFYDLLERLSLSKKVVFNIQGEKLSFLAFKKKIIKYKKARKEDLVSFFISEMDFCFMLFF